MIKKSLTLFLYAFLYLPVYLSQLQAQIENKAKTPIEHLNQADFLFKKKKYDTSTIEVKKALLLYRSMNDIRGMASCYNKLALNLVSIAKYDSAKSHLDSTMILLKRDKKVNHDILGKYYYLLGYINCREDNFEASIQNLDKALDTYKSTTTVSDFDIAKVNEFLGINYYHRWSLNKAEEHIEKALKVYLNMQQDAQENISLCYMYLARIYTRSEQHSKALVYNKKTLTLNRNIYGDTHYQVGLGHAIMAITYGRMVDFEKSLVNYEKANRIFISNFGEGHKWVVTTYENIGRSYNRLGDFNKSLENYKKAISLGIKHLGEDHLVVAHVFLNAADTYASIGDNVRALELYQKALVVQKKAYGEKHREVAQNYIAQGNFYNHIQEHNSALEKFTWVINTYETEISSALDSDLIIEEMNVLYKIIEAIEGKALTLKLLYKKEGDIEHIIASKKLFEQAQSIIEKMRLATTTQEDKISLTASNQVSLRGIIETNFILYEVEDEQRLLQEAFFYSERNRGRVLQQISQQNAITSTDFDLKKLLEKEMKIKENKSLYLSKIENEKKDKLHFDSLKITGYENQLFQINLQYDSLTEKMQQNYPNYFNIEFGKSISNLVEIQAGLNTNTTLLEYFVADSTTTYVFVVTNKNFVAKRIRTKDLVKKVKRLKRAIIDKNIQSFKQSASRLYDDLIAPISDELVGNELIIIPDGPAWHINFELLLTKNQSSNNPKDFDYLLNEYSISYANSASLLMNTKVSEKEYEDDVLAFSFSDSILSGQNISMATLRNQIDDLPGTRKEIKEIAKLIDGDYFFGNQAHEENFKKSANNYKILHLALHGEVDNEKPQNSRLYFTKGKDTIQDNILYGHELSNLDLSVDLVVLSACNTGTGKVTAGEGIMSLGNAFQYAGTKSILISGWEVSDDTAPELMKYFYTNLKDGMSKPRALQQAKLSYLKNAEAQRSAPFYWGSFYLVGDTAPISLSSSLKWPYLIFGSSIILVSLFWFRRYRSRSKKAA